VIIDYEYNAIIFCPFVSMRIHVVSVCACVLKALIESCDNDSLASDGFVRLVSLFDNEEVNCCLVCSFNAISC